MNDDFCDCYDSGFDEFTTTSACSHLDNAPLLQASTTGTGTSVASIRTCRVPQSRYFDGICDCCDGSDERPGLCHDTCADTYQQTITSAIAVLQMTTRGHKQYRNAMKDATKQMKTMHDKVEALAKSRQELRQLEVTLQIYMNDERNSEPTKGGWPRYDYAMLAKQFMMKELQEAKRAGLRAAPPRKDDIVLHPILDVKCPSSDFTLDNFFRVMTAPTNDPRKVGWYGMPPGADKNLLLDKMLENPTLLALRIVGTILFTPVQIPLFGANSVMARVLGWEEGAEEVAEVKLAQTATPLEVEIEAPDPYSLNTILLKLTIIHPALDYRLYPVTRRSVQGIRRLYRQITEPLGVMWESPMVVLNNTIAWGGGAMIKDPDSHEFRLLKAAAEKLKRSMRDVGNKLEAAGDELRKDYGPLITVNGNSYSSDIEKYVYRISPLKDVRQDTTKLGFFEVSPPPPHTFVIKGLVRCEQSQNRANSSERASYFAKLSQTQNVHTGTLNDRYSRGSRA